MVGTGLKREARMGPVIAKPWALGAGALARAHRPPKRCSSGCSEVAHARVPPQTGSSPGPTWRYTPPNCSPPPRFAAVLLWCPLPTGADTWLHNSSRVNSASDDCISEWGLSDQKKTVKGGGVAWGALLRRLAGSRGRMGDSSHPLLAWAGVKGETWPQWLTLLDPERFRGGGGAGGRRRRGRLGRKRNGSSR